MKISQQLRAASLLLLALTGGILMGLTPAPVEAWPLGWIALVPLWFLVGTSLKGSAQKTKVGQTVTHPPICDRDIRQPALYGLVWGIGFHGLALFWITGVYHPMKWMGVPWLAKIGITAFCWTFITLWGAVLVALWAALLVWILNFRFWISQKSGLLSFVRVVLGIALWCGLEALWSASPLWWTSLSYTQSPHNLIILHLGQLSGPSTVTSVIVAVNGLIGEAWLSYSYHLDAKQELKVRRLLAPQDSTTSNIERLNLQSSKRQPVTLAGIAVVLLVVSHLIGFGLYNRPLIQSEAAALNVGIIQGNIGNDIKLFPEGKRLALERYTDSYLKLVDEGVDAVLTPEGALPFLMADLKYQSFYSAILEKGVVAWVGAWGERGNSYVNSLLTIPGTGEIYSIYNKVHVVPLGEYIPFEPILGKFINRLSPLNASQVGGSPNQLFDTPFGRAIAGICYDSAFAEHFRRQAAAGGQFILTASNNADYTESMPAQHHAQDVMRAIESDRWAARATNTGYSGIVDPHGRTLWISGINTYESHADTIYRRQTQTLYVRWGDWLTKVLLALSGVAWLFLRQSPTR
jgi:apolipoprotein N-acyltransferase